MAKAPSRGSKAAAAKKMSAAAEERGEPKVSPRANAAEERMEAKKKVPKRGK
jgi:hypothetical protein